MRFRQSDGTTVLYIGAENWPLPVPLISENGKWRFDGDAGTEEILFRQIGENEAVAIQVCHALARAVAGESSDSNASANGYAQILVNADLMVATAWQTLNQRHSNGYVNSEAPARFARPTTAVLRTRGSRKPQFSRGGRKGNRLKQRAVFKSLCRSCTNSRRCSLSNDDRYRGLKGLRTVIFMNDQDMRDRGIEEFALVDVKSFSKDGKERTVYGYRAFRDELPSGCSAGYMPELNVLCGIADFSTQSEQPVTKHLVVEVALARSKEADRWGKRR